MLLVSIHFKNTTLVKGVAIGYCRINPKRVSKIVICTSQMGQFWLVLHKCLGIEHPELHIEHVATYYSCIDAF